MGISVKWGLGDYKSSDYTQQELRSKFIGSRADIVFFSIMGAQLSPYIGKIRTLFRPPKSVGIHFDFAKGKQKEFAELIDPPRRLGKISPTTFQKPGHSPMIPDNPGHMKPAQIWRNAASLKGIGASYRSEGIGSSLHVAFNKDSCDIHVDRAGFVKRDAMGRVTWDLNGLLGHMTSDLLSDFTGKAMPLPLATLQIGNEKLPIFEATLAPWLAIDLPSKANKQKWSMTVGMALSGTHSFWDGSE